MVGEWEAVALGDVADTRNGAGIKQDFFSPTGVPLARVSNFTDWSIDMTDCIRVDAVHAKRWESHRLNEGDVVVATVGSWPPNWSSVVGKAVRVPRSVVGTIQNQNTCCVIARPGITDQRFLFYLLRTEAFVHYAANAAAGSANQARLPVAHLERYPFALPPLPEQRAIAHILGTLDDKIELNRRMNETLEAMARAIFKDWFVDFGPTRTKAEGRPSYLAPDLWSLFPAALDDDDKPVGWEYSKLGSLGSTALGGLWGEDSQQTDDHEEVICLRGVDLEHLRFQGSAPEAPTRWVKKSGLEKRRISDRDVLSTWEKLNSYRISAQPRR